MTDLTRLLSTDEADNYIRFIGGLLKNRNEDGSLQIMSVNAIFDAGGLGADSEATRYTIWGGKNIPDELELDLDGHKSQKPGETW